VKKFLFIIVLVIVLVSILFVQSADAGSPPGPPNLDNVKVDTGTGIFDPKNPVFRAGANTTISATGDTILIESSVGSAPDTVIYSDTAGAAKSSEVIYAPQEGLVGDSVTDETVNFKAMLAKASTGWTIYLQPGKVYRVTDSCTVPVGVQIDGAGSKVYFEAEDGEGGFFLSSGVAIHNLTVETDTVESFNPATHGGMGTAISVGNYMSGAGASNVTLDHVTLSASRARGNVLFITGNSANFVLTNYRIVPGGKTATGILAHWGGATSPTVKTYHPYNLIYQNGIIDSLPDSSTGFSFSGAYLGTITNAEVMRCGTAINVHPGDYGYMYADTAVYDSTIFAGGPFNFSNVISHADSVGFKFSGAAGSVAEKFTIPISGFNLQTYGRDTAAAKSGQAGFRFDNYAGNAKFIGCRTVRHYNGVTFGAYARQVYFEYCDFYRAGSYGAYIDYASGKPDNIYFTNCNFIDNYNGIYLGDANRVSVQGCQFEGSYYGVFMDHPSSDLRAILLNNYVKTAINHANSSFLRIDTLNAELTKPVIFLGNKTAFDTIEVVSVASEIALAAIPSIDTMQVTFLRVGGDGVTGVGTGSTEVAAGNHGHADYLPLAGGTIVGDIRVGTGNYVIGSTASLLDSIYVGYGFFGGVYVDMLDVGMVENTTGPYISFLTNIDMGSSDIVGVDSLGTARAYIGNRIVTGIGTGATQVSSGDHTHSLLHTRSHAISGTSDHTATAYRIFWSNAAGQIVEKDLGTSGQYLQSQGATTAPIWATGSGYWNLLDGTRDTIVYASGGESLFVAIFGSDSTKMWSTNNLIIGPEGLFESDSIHVGDLLYFDPLVPFDSATWDSMVNLTGRYAGGSGSVDTSRIGLGLVTRGPTPGDTLASQNDTIDVSFAGTGSATTVSRSDHNHDATYSTITGETYSGTHNFSSATINLPSAAVDAAAEIAAGIIDSTKIVAASLSEANLLISNAPTDEYCLTWEASAGTGGQMTWEAQAGTGGGLTYFTEADDGVISVLTPTSPNTGMRLGDSGRTRVPDLMIGRNADTARVQSVGTGFVDGKAMVCYDETGRDSLAPGDIDIDFVTGDATDNDRLDSNVVAAIVHKAERDASGNVITATYSTIASPNFTGTLTADSAQFDGNVDVDSMDINGVLDVTGTATAAHVKATSSLKVGSDSLIDITGTNLSITNGVLNASGGVGTVTDAILEDSLDAYPDTTAWKKVIDDTTNWKAAYTATSTDTMIASEGEVEDSLDNYLSTQRPDTTSQNIVLNGGNIVMQGAETVDGKDVSTLGVGTVTNTILGDSLAGRAGDIGDSINARLVKAVTGNTETGIAVSYDPADSTIDFVAEVTQAEFDAVCDDSLALIKAKDSVAAWDNNAVFLLKAGGDVDSIRVDSLIVDDELLIPVGTNPTVSVEGDIAWETDEDGFRVHDGAANRLMPSFDDFDFTIIKPDLVNDEVKVFRVDAKMYPFGITIVHVDITLPADAAYTLVFEEWAGDPPAAQADIETVTTAASDAYMEDEAITNNVVDADDYIFIHVPATDVDWLAGKVIFYVNSGD
jgi:hypothetical protein